MLCWARYLFIAVVAVLGAGQMIAACGQKGDLYLVEKEEPAPLAEAPSTAPAPEVQTGENVEMEEDMEDAAEVQRATRR